MFTAEESFLVFYWLQRVTRKLTSSLGLKQQIISQNECTRTGTAVSLQSLPGAQAPFLEESKDHKLNFLGKHSNRYTTTALHKQQADNTDIVTTDFVDMPDNSDIVGALPRTPGTSGIRTFGIPEAETLGHPIFQTSCRDHKSETALIEATTAAFDYLAHRSAGSRSHRGIARPSCFNVQYQASCCQGFFFFFSLKEFITVINGADSAFVILADGFGARKARQGVTCCIMPFSKCQLCRNTAVLCGQAYAMCCCEAYQKWKGASVKGHSIQSLIMHICTCHLLS